MPLNSLPPTTTPENLATKVTLQKCPKSAFEGAENAISPNILWIILDPCRATCELCFALAGECSPWSVLGGCWILGRSHSWQCFKPQGITDDNYMNTFSLKAMVDLGVPGFKCFLIHSGVDEFPAVTREQVNSKNLI